jgi:hypothetical protein
VSENKVLRRIFQPRGAEVTRITESYKIRRFIICTRDKIQLGDDMGRAYNTHG